MGGGGGGGGEGRWSGMFEIMSSTTGTGERSSTFLNVMVCIIVHLCCPNLLSLLSKFLDNRFEIDI